jgi:hypothetical protein
MVQWYQKRTVQITVAPGELTRRYRDGESLNDLGILCDCAAMRIRSRQNGWSNSLNHIPHGVVR